VLSFNTEQNLFFCPYQRFFFELHSNIGLGFEVITWGHDSIVTSRKPKMGSWSHFWIIYVTWMLEWSSGNLLYISFFVKTSYLFRLLFRLPGFQNLWDDATSGYNPRRSNKRPWSDCPDLHQGNLPPDSPCHSCSCWTRKCFINICFNFCWEVEIVELYHYPRFYPG
jgi:hypothetical protein